MRGSPWHSAPARIPVFLAMSVHSKAATACMKSNAIMSHHSNPIISQRVGNLHSTSTVTFFSLLKTTPGRIKEWIHASMHFHHFADLSTKWRFDCMKQFSQFNQHRQSSPYFKHNIFQFTQFTHSLKNNQGKSSSCVLYVWFSRCLIFSKREARTQVYMKT